MKQLFIHIVVILFTTFVFAQSPENMGYQAVMRNADNSLISNTVIGVKISILQGTLSGTVVYAETQTPTTDVNGLVSMVIGNGSIISGVFASIDWSNGPYFIKTETDPEGGTAYVITGASQLLSVPYALHAKTADRIAGSSSSDNNIQNQKASAQSADFWISGDSMVDGKVYINGLQTLYVPNQNDFDGSLIIGTGGLNLTNSAPNPIIAPGSSGVNNGKQNTFIGSSSGKENTSGNQNTFVGTWSGVKNTIGDQNTFIGMNSGWQNTTGYHSTYVGAWAGQANTTGHRNAFFGTDTGNYNTTGYENSYFGNGAGVYGETGFSNSFFGVLAGAHNLVSNNSFFGRLSGYTNTTGANNVFFGANSGYNNTTGYDNVYLGQESSKTSTTGYRNVSIGKGSSFNTTTGNFNVSIGTYAGADVTTGSSNVFIGNGSGGIGQKEDAINSIAIGANTFTTKDNQLVLGNSSITETILNGVVAFGDNTKNITTKGISFGMEEGNIEFIGSKIGAGFGSKIYQNGERALSIAGRNNSNIWTDNFTILDTGNVGIGYSNGTELDNNKLAVNGNGFFNGTIKLNNLAGIGKRVVVADASGNLSTDSTDSIDYIKNQNASAQSANMWIDGDIKTKQLTVTQGVVAFGDNTKNITTKGISFGMEEGNIEFIGSKFGAGFGSKIYQNGERALSIAGRKNSNTWTDNFTVLDTGNVGIGYSNGTELNNNKLAVNGSGFFNGTIKLNNLAGIGTRMVVADASGNLSTDSADYIKNQNVSAQSASMWIDGNIKAKQLIVDGEYGVNLNSGWQIGASNNNGFYIFSNILGSEGLSIKNNGNVLLNEISDNGVDKLQVKGSVLATAIKKVGGLADDILMADGSTQKINGSITLGYAIKSTDYTLAMGDRTVEVVNPSTITLPTAEGIAGREYRIVNTSSGNVIVDTTFSQTIGNKPTGNPTTIILAPEETLNIVSNGSKWRKI